MSPDTSLPTQSSRRRPLVVLVFVSVLIAGLLIGPPADAAPSLKTRNDKVTIALGKRAVVNVLANDRVPGKKKHAHVKVVRKAGLVVKVKGNRKVMVRVPANARPGVHKVRYKVTAKARSSKATVIVRVPKRKFATNPVPVPAGDTLQGLIATLPVAAEQRAGYDRARFKHWNAGDIWGDGCDTRSEVLIVEANVPVAPGTKCPIYSARSGGGQWYSYYDGVTTDNPSLFDIDHLVPLAESWDSGAHAWDDATRELFANDQGDPRSLVAVTATSNRQKSDQDPAQWLPLLERCRYIGEWVAVKHRWALSIDQAEKDALNYTAQGCDNVVVAVISRN